MNVNIKNGSNLILVFLTLSSFLISNAQNAPFNLRCVDKVNPVGTNDKPYFGWYMNDPDDDEIQTAYQVLVASNPELLTEENADVWNSGKVESGMQNFVYFDGKPLSSSSDYYWKVKLWDKDGDESSYSDVAHFSTGLFENSDWSGAKWIKRDNSERDDYTFYRKDFTIDNKTVERAVAYVSAVHEFELYLNGQLVGKGPGYHYPQYQYYSAFDITDMLADGNDQLFACLTHWFGGGQGRPKSERGFLLKAVLEYSDGSREIISTDSSWKQIRAPQWEPGMSTRNGEGVGYIEKIHADKILPNWNTQGFDDSKWSSAVEIGEHPVSPWTGILQPNLAQLIEEEITPVSVKSLGNSRYIIDLGKVYSGVPKITFTGGAADSTITILGGYTLNEDGTINENTNQRTNMYNYFVHNGETAVFQPFTYLGMRYIQVDNSPSELTADNCKFITRHYELNPNRSHFKSSNEWLNKVWELMKHSLIIGSQESFVDTPTREKGGFLGDSWSIGASVMANMGDRILNQRILNEFLSSQDQFWPDGRMNAVYPNGDGGRDIPDYTQMFLLWAWDYYMQTGDKAFLQNNYPQFKKITDYILDYKNSNTGLIHNLAGGGGPYLYGIIDWPQTMRYGYDMDTESRTVMDAYALSNFEIMARIADILNKTGDQSDFDQMAKDMKMAINKSLLNDRGVYIDGLRSDSVPSENASQHANMLPLALGIVPDENRESVINLVKDKEMSVGMVTLRWLPEALGQADEGEHLLKLYTNPEWDGWARTVSLGGTATWESWDALEIGESLSHPWGAVGLLGMQSYFMGVTPLKPQHELVQIKPLDFGEQAMQIEGSIPTDRGVIDIEWTREDGNYTMNLTIPDNMKAKVYVPQSVSSNSTIRINDKKVKGTVENDYLFLGVLGSGDHKITNK